MLEVNHCSRCRHSDCCHVIEAVLKLLGSEKADQLRQCPALRHTGDFRAGESHGRHVYAGIPLRAIFEEITLTAPLAPVLSKAASPNVAAAEEGLQGVVRRIRCSHL